MLNNLNIVEAKSTAELSLEKLEELKAKGVKSIKIKNEIAKKEYMYQIDTFIKIKQEILKNTHNVPKIAEDDIDREKKIFTYIYEKIAKNIVYDEKAAICAGYTGYEREMSGYLVDRASGLEGIIFGKALCSGYSEILRNILSEVGIEALYICGGAMTKGEKGDAHAWNQVSLDGKWYNCDITNDADFILAGLKLPLFLKSNEEFGRYTKYPCQDMSQVKEAKESITGDQQDELIEWARQQILSEEKALEESEKVIIPEGPIEILKSLFKKYKINAKELKELGRNNRNRGGEGKV